MAREPAVLEEDEPASTAGEWSNDGSNGSLLGRRSYLAATATTVAGAVGAASATGAAAAEDFDTVEVAAGDRHQVQLGDGDTLENLLIDISAKGAEYSIHAVGNDITIRNLAVRGQWDNTSQESPLIMAVPDENSSSRIENVYLADGAVGDTYPNGPTGIFVAAKHAGTLEIDAVNIQGMPDNAVYGSSPGNPSDHPNPGSGGVVEITNSYAADCNAGGFRIGTDGSFVENCVMTGNDRNFWGYFNDTELRDSDVSDGNMQDVRVGSSSWSTSASVTVENSRFDSTSTATSNDQVVGSSQGDPQTEPPEAVPRSPEEAASGSSRPSGRQSESESDDGDAESESDDGDAESEGDEGGAFPHLLRIDGSAVSCPSTYEFTVTGDLLRVEDASESVEETVDGAAEGTVANSRDSYRFGGEIDDFRLAGEAGVVLEYDVAE